MTLPFQTLTRSLRQQKRFNRTAVRQWQLYRGKHCRGNQSKKRMTEVKTRTREKKLKKLNTVRARKTIRSFVFRIFPSVDFNSTKAYESYHSYVIHFFDWFPLQ